jgi:hypothetical protein
MLEVMRMMESPSVKRAALCNPRSSAPGSDLSRYANSRVAQSGPKPGNLAPA